MSAPQQSRDVRLRVKGLPHGAYCLDTAGSAPPASKRPKPPTATLRSSPTISPAMVSPARSTLTATRSSASINSTAMPTRKRKWDGRWNSWVLNCSAPAHRKPKAASNASIAPGKTASPKNCPNDAPRNVGRDTVQHALCRQYERVLSHHGTTHSTEKHSIQACALPFRFIATVP